MNYVYLLTNKSHYKIGRAKNPAKRVKQLQTGSSSKIDLLYSIPCKDSKKAAALESKLHKQFSRHRKLGEWFVITPAIICEFIKLEGVVKDDGPLKYSAEFYKI